MTVQIVNTIFRNSYIGKSNLKRTMKPVIGYKKSRLIIEMDDVIAIDSIQGPEGFKRVALNDVSKCPSSERHIGKPSRFCTCGFYSYSEMEDALSHLRGSHCEPILKVVASGKMLMYEKGLRAAHQRVEEVIFHTCATPYCFKPADRIVISRKFNVYGSEITGVCSEHGLNGRGGYHGNCETFSWLEERLAESLFKGEPPIKVRQLNSSVKPWDGTDEEQLLVTVSTKSKNYTGNWLVAGMAVIASTGAYAMFFLGELLKVVP